LQALKAPRPEPERTPQTPKRPAEARDAREVARKLLKSGAITAITKTPKRPEQAGFKRPRGLERKLSGTERTVSGYQPFSAAHPEDMETDSRPKVKVCSCSLFCYSLIAEYV
jgi:negative elongation factor E